MNLNIKNRFEINLFKTVILIVLLLASYCALNVEDAGLCVMSFYEKGVLTHFHEIQGSEIDDGAVFGGAGILGFIFSSIFILKLSRAWMIGLFSTLCILQLLSLCMVTIPLNQIIHDSLKFCDNVWLLGFLIFQMIFIVLNLLYIHFSLDGNQKNDN